MRGSACGISAEGKTSSALCGFDLRSSVLIASAIVVVAVAVALIGEALAFGSARLLAALVIGLLAVSLIDRDRFWAADLRRTRSPR